MIKALIFDLDGTTANTIYDLQHAMNMMLSEYGYPLADEQLILKSINNGSFVFVCGCLPEGVGEERQKAAHLRYNQCYSTCFMDRTVAYDGIADSLKYLKTRGFKLGVLSNKDMTHVRGIIKKLFPDIFDEVWGVSEMFPPKPEPQSAIHVASLLGATPDETLFVGDSNIDIETALAAGMHPIGVSWGYRSPEILRECGAVYIADTCEDIKYIPERIKL